MSTKCTLAYGDNFHLYNEVCDDDHVYLEEREYRPEGVRPIYFFSFLKGLRTVLLDAHARGLAVMHIRYVYLFIGNP